MDRQIPRLREQIKFFLITLRCPPSPPPLSRLSTPISRANTADPTRNLMACQTNSRQSDNLAKQLRKFILTVYFFQFPIFKYTNTADFQSFSICRRKYFYWHKYTILPTCYKFWNKLGDTFQFYRIQMKCLYLWEGKKYAHCNEKISYTRIFSIRRKILLQKFYYYKKLHIISTLAFPFSCPKIRY